MTFDTDISYSEEEPLRHYVASCLSRYFRELNGHQPNDLYRMVLNQVEAPLLEAVMNYSGGNQSQAAEMLGINRGTLRKKLRHYGLDHRLDNQE